MLKKCVLMYFVLALMPLQSANLLQVMAVLNNITLGKTPPLSVPPQPHIESLKAPLSVYFCSEKFKKGFLPQAIFSATQYENILVAENNNKICAFTVHEITECSTITNVLFGNNRFSPQFDISKFLKVCNELDALHRARYIQSVSTDGVHPTRGLLYAYEQQKYNKEKIVQVSIQQEYKGSKREKNQRNQKFKN